MRLRHASLKAGSQTKHKRLRPVKELNNNRSRLSSRPGRAGQRRGLGWQVQGYGLAAGWQGVLGGFARLVCREVKHCRSAG
jgi:hypothetical protein